MPIQAKEQNQDPLKVAFDIFSKGAKRFQCLAQNTNSLALFFFFCDLRLHSPFTSSDRWE